jgi:hypothetical protein
MTRPSAPTTGILSHGRVGCGQAPPSPSSLLASPSDDEQPDYFIAGAQKQNASAKQTP